MTDLKEQLASMVDAAERAGEMEAKLDLVRDTLSTLLANLNGTGPAKCVGHNKKKKTDKLGRARRRKISHSEQGQIRHLHRTGKNCYEIGGIVKRHPSSVRNFLIRAGDYKPTPKGVK